MKNLKIKWLIISLVILILAAIILLVCFFIKNYRITDIRDDDGYINIKDDRIIEERANEKSTELLDYTENIKRDCSLEAHVEKAVGQTITFKIDRLSSVNNCDQYGYKIGGIHEVPLNKEKFNGLASQVKNIVSSANKYVFIVRENCMGACVIEWNLESVNGKKFSGVMSFYLP